MHYCPHALPGQRSRHTVPSHPIGAWPLTLLCLRLRLFFQNMGRAVGGGWCFTVRLYIWTVRIFPDQWKTGFQELCTSLRRTDTVGGDGSEFSRKLWKPLNLLWVRCRKTVPYQRQHQSFVFNFSRRVYDYLLVLLVCYFCWQTLCSPLGNYLELFLSLALPSKESHPGMAEKWDICSLPDDGKTYSTSISLHQRVNNNRPLCVPSEIGCLFQLKWHSWRL